jgi:hypothetical protein
MPILTIGLTASYADGFDAAFTLQTVYAFPDDSNFTVISGAKLTIL